MGDAKDIIDKCSQIVQAYREGILGDSDLPEDNAPAFRSLESKLAYFTLPMSLNYRRNSTRLWESALATYEDDTTLNVFSASVAAQMPVEKLRCQLAKYGLALQPTRHTLNWHIISNTVYDQWGSFEGMIRAADSDFLKLKDNLQRTYKKGFPYLAGPKLFNYWCFILGTKCGVELQNKQYIDIAIDSHIVRCSVKLGAISSEEQMSFTSEAVADRPLVLAQARTRRSHRKAHGRPEKYYSRRPESRK